MQVQVLWTIVVGFLVGVFARSFLNFGWWTIFFFLECACATVLITFSARIEWWRGGIAAIALCAIAAGSARMHVSVFEGEPALDAWLNEKVAIEGVVADEPDARENNIRIPVRVESVAGTAVETDMKVLVVAPLHTAVSYGDRIHAEGELQLPENFEAGEGREFHYPAYLAKDSVGYEMSFASVKNIGEAPRNPLKLAAIFAKQSYLEGLAMALPEPAAGLAGGITAGDKRGLGKDLSDVFRIVGLVHIVVLSGYNIMIVISFIERIFGWTKVWVRSLLAVTIAIFFALITGLASSSVRAASMAVIATAGKASGREYLASRALGVVAVAMVLWNPFVLAFDPGFQLSMIATLGLIYIAPLFGERLRWLTERFGVRETAAATLGTQAAVLPLLVYQNGTLSIYSLPANLLALAVVPYAMLLSFIAGIFGIIVSPIAPIIGFPAYMLLTYVLKVAEFFAWLPYAALSVPAFSFVWLPIFYCLLALLVYKIMRPRGARSR